MTRKFFLLFKKNLSWSLIKIHDSRFMWNQWRNLFYVSMIAPIFFPSACLFQFDLSPYLRNLIAISHLLLRETLNFLQWQSWSDYWKWLDVTLLNLRHVGNYKTCIPFSMVVCHLCLIIVGPGFLVILREGAGLVKRQNFQKWLKTIKFKGLTNFTRGP